MSFRATHSISNELRTLRSNQHIDVLIDAWQNAKARIGFRLQRDHKVQYPPFGGGHDERLDTGVQFVEQHYQSCEYSRHKIPCTTCMRVVDGALLTCKCLL